ncbi:MAG: hypothetical protein IJT87_12690 [Ruminiclostridium sp.]|nr:hypothetical protein [Ruminiclostridium sp.]
MKNTSTLRNRIIAGMLAIITTYSALAVTASAESIPASAGDNLLTVGSHTATAEDNIKEKTNNDGGLDIKGPKKTMIDDSTFNTPKVGNGGLSGPSKRK